MAFLGLPPQLTRIVALVIGIGATYCVARVALTPRSFGQYGHYRGAALEELASREPIFAGAKACDECHGEVAEKLARFEHKKISCESCHAPARRHADDPDVATTKLDNATCVRCHDDNGARPVWLKPNRCCSRCLAQSRRHSPLRTTQESKLI